MVHSATGVEFMSAFLNSVPCFGIEKADLFVLKIIVMFLDEVCKKCLFTCLSKRNSYFFYFQLSEEIFLIYSQTLNIAGMP